MAQSFSVVRYTLFPEFWPRIREFTTSGFGTIATLLAIIFRSAQLLPPNHPYLKPQSYGQFSIRNVLSEAGNNLVFSRKNIDQIILYFAVLSGISLIVIQFILFITALITQQPAMAQLVPPEDILKVTSQYNPGPENDLVFMVMDRVFGTEGIFNSCISTGGDCDDIHGNPLPNAGGVYPAPFHKALHMMFRFYSFGIFIIGIVILAYFIVAMVAETAVNGTPFGQRANKLWYPVRFILFVGLIIPLNIGGQNAGLNGAQIITLWAAKAGSNFATNGWNRFLDNLGGSRLAFSDDVIAKPNIPDLGSLIEFIFIAKTCAIAEEAMFLHDVEPYLVRAPQQNPLVPKKSNEILMESADFDMARRFSKYGSILIRFGVLGKKDDKHYKDFHAYKGTVAPTCGDLRLQVMTSDQTNDIRLSESGTTAVQKYYYDKVILDLWKDTTLSDWAMCIARETISKLRDKKCADANFPTAKKVREFISTYEKNLSDKIQEFVDQQDESTNWDVSEQLKAKGWGAAAVWYNRISQMNGELVSGVMGVPLPAQYPAAMEDIAQQHKMASENIGSGTAFDLTLPQGKQVRFSRGPREKETAIAMIAAFNLWENEGFAQTEKNKTTGNAVVDTINAVFGTAGIFDMRENADIHPLGQLSSLGRGMLEASVRNLGLGIAGGGIAKMFKGLSGNLAQLGGDFLYGIGLTMFAMSFILAYVLPFLPFIYMMFAISSWVKTIFEAMVAMPLWAVAHISNIDGEGIPGRAAVNGYILIFEIVIRPILIIVGLIASVSIFSALVMALNDLFDLVVANLSGHGVPDGQPLEDIRDSFRGPVDEFFFTVIYTIIVYVLALSSFKLIDTIPTKILRWMGQSIATFQDGAQEQAGQVVTRAYSGIKIGVGGAKGGLLAGLVS